MWVKELCIYLYFVASVAVVAAIHVHIRDDEYESC